jgi:hypothetical protein
MWPAQHTQTAHCWPAHTQLWHAAALACKWHDRTACATHGLQKVQEGSDRCMPQPGTAGQHKQAQHRTHAPKTGPATAVTKDSSKETQIAGASPAAAGRSQKLSSPGLTHLTPAATLSLGRLLACLKHRNSSGSGSQECTNGIGAGLDGPKDCSGAQAATNGPVGQHDTHTTHPHNRTKSWVQRHADT